MTTPVDLIKRALLDIQELGEGESPSAAQTTDGLAYLNDLIEAWSVEGAPIYTNTAFIKTATGAGSYTFGDGGTWNTGTGYVPIEITSMTWSTDLQTFYDIQFISYEEWLLLPNHTTTTSTQPQYYTVQYNNPSPWHTVTFYNRPSTGYLTALALCKLTSGAFTSTTVLSLPTGYDRALRLALAVEFMPQYGKNNPLLIQMADKAKRDIMSRNLTNRPVRMNLGLPTVGASRSNILLG